MGLDVVIKGPIMSRIQMVGAIILGIAGTLAHSQAGFAAGDAAHGERIYRQCMACHTLDKNAIGPKHRDVFGRKAGSVADYEYSAALKASNIVWDEATLNAWLTNPQTLVPGSKMFFSVGSAEDRADVIAFLKDKARGDTAAAAAPAAPAAPASEAK
jgi:cytochrome c